MDDVVLNKAAAIERCVQRVREEHAGDPRNLTGNLTRQDSIILNIQRATEAAIDLSMLGARSQVGDFPGVPRGARAAREGGRVAGGAGRAAQAHGGLPQRRGP